jgi:hypothetical protein
MDHWMKAKRAFDIRNLKIPEYVPEAGDKVYSKMDFIELAKGNLKYAALLRERCTWQHCWKAGDLPGCSDERPQFHEA